MPASSERQRRAACAELGRRRRGKRGAPGRPFATASVSDLRDFCTSPVKPARKKEHR